MPPSYIISIKSNEEYFVGMSCEHHYKSFERKIQMLQQRNLLPKGKINIQNSRIISTDCVKCSNEDYEEVIAKRELEFRT